MRTIQMQALTICQPYAHLIVTPQDQLSEPQKRVENRTWFTPYRGMLAIHAGKSDKWLRPGDPDRYPAMAYGAVVGIAELVTCVRLDGRIPSDLAWVASHEHSSGPWVWVLRDARPLLRPFPCRGAQGLWTVEIPEELMPLPGS